MWYHDVPEARLILEIVQEILHNFLRRFSLGPSSPPFDCLERPLALSIGEPMLCASATKAMCVETIVSMIHESSIRGIPVQLI